MTRMCVVRVARARLASAVAVADDVRTGIDGRVDGRPERCKRGAAGLDQDDVAVRADRRGHVQIERYLLAPTAVCARIRALHAVLIQLLEAAVRPGARRQAVLRAIRAEVGFGVGIVVRIDDPDRLAGAAGGWKRIRRLQIARSVPCNGGGEGVPLAGKIVYRCIADVGALQREADDLVTRLHVRARRDDVRLHRGGAGTGCRKRRIRPARACSECE